MTKEQPMPNWAFRGMALTLRFMELFRRPKERLEKVGLAPGQIVLEYGCGIGSFTIPTAQIVGEEGTVYAVDIQPLAIEAVRKRAAKGNLTNIKVILSDRATGLPDESVDVVLLYDTLHLVKDKPALLQELHRVLKADGHLSADHEHTDREAFLDTMRTGNLFALQDQNGEVLGFSKL
jgi:ubiquinone/menaquinone biosynthesis C-methylase UbiE